MKLLTSQQNCFDKLSKVKVGALFMEPGSGKTRTCIELINSVSGIDYILYIAPYQGIFSENCHESIIGEINKWGGFNADVDYYGIESFSNSDTTYLKVLNKMQHASNPAMIVDEGLKIKNNEAKRTTRIIYLSKFCEYKLLLNGTPLSKNLLDLWSQMEFLSPLILRMSQSEFKNTFVEYTTVKKKIGFQSITKEYINKYHNLDYLYRLIEPFIFEADLDININKQHINVNYNITDIEFEKHKELKEKFLDNELLQFKNNNIFLEICQKLQHNYSVSPEKFVILDNILKKHNVDKVTIVAKYIDTQELLKSKYSNTRILSWQKNAYALNLQKYNVLVKFDKHWDYALHDQIEHRFFRTGQKSDVIIYDLTGNVGLEKLMTKNIDTKGELLRLFKQKTINQIKELL